MGYTKRMFSSKFNALSSNELIFLDNGNVVIQEGDDVQEFEKAGID